MTYATKKTVCAGRAARDALPGVVLAAVIASVTASSAPAWGQDSPSSWAEQGRLTGTQEHHRTGTPPVPIVAEFTLSGDFVSHAVGGYTFSGPGVSATGAAFGIERALLGGGSLRAGLVFGRHFAVGAVGSLFGLIVADGAPSNERVASQLIVSHLVGGAGGLELGAVLPLGRLSLRTSAMSGILTMGAPATASGHTCTGSARGGGTFSYPCYGTAGMSAPWAQVRVAVDYEIANPVSVGVEGALEPVPWLGWSAGAYVRLHFPLATPPRREPL